MTIGRVEAILLDDIPIAPPPVRPGPSRAGVIIVEIETNEGAVGYGISPGPAWPVAEFVNRVLSDFLHGKDPALVENIWLQMVRQFGGADGGIWAPALSAADIALWDIRGKSLGQPVWKLLGGARSSVPAYVSFGVAGPNTSASQYPVYSQDELVDEARSLVGLGHTRLKTVVGRAIVPNPGEDARRIGAIREAVGPDVELLIDAGTKLSLHDALQLCRLCEPHQIVFFEEPVLANDPFLLAELRKQTAIPIAANPRGYRRAYRDLLMNGSVDILQPNVKSIGITESVQIAGMAEAFHLPVANGNGAGPHNIHLLAGVQNGWLCEFHFHNWMMYRAVYESVPEPMGGWVTAPEVPGLGLDPKPEVVKEFRKKTG